MQNKKRKSIFESDYFKNYYFAMTGNFEIKDLNRNKKWFYGWFRELIKLYDFKKGENKNALEIGCAIGAAADILSEYSFKVTATDISPYAIKKAKKLLPHINFDVYDVQEKPYRSNSFDLIYSFEVLEHLTNPEKAIKNMFDMLKPGGVLICSTPYPYDYVYIDKTHINVRYPLEWILAFRQAGFYKIKFVQKSFIPFFYRISKKFHIILPGGYNTRYINSPVFIYGQKALK